MLCGSSELCDINRFRYHIVAWSAVTTRRITDRTNLQKLPVDTSSEGKSVLRDS